MGTQPYSTELAKKSRGTVVLRRERLQEMLSFISQHPQLHMVVMPVMCTIFRDDVDVIRRILLEFPVEALQQQAGVARGGRARRSRRGRGLLRVMIRTFSHCHGAHLLCGVFVASSGVSTRGLRKHFQTPSSIVSSVRVRRQRYPPQHVVHALAKIGVRLRSFFRLEIAVLWNEWRTQRGLVGPGQTRPSVWFIVR